MDWRVPLAIQCIGPFALFGVVYFVPEALGGVSIRSPRTFVQSNHGFLVYMNGKAAEAEKVLLRFHRGTTGATRSYAHDEFTQMKRQIDHELETNQTVRSVREDAHLRKRFIVGFLATSASQCSGSIVILSKYTEPIVCL